ncbi:MAG: flagellar hook-length control protein FliK [Oscillospiraceae bacterium]
MQIILNGTELENAYAAGSALPTSGLTGNGLEAGSTFEAAVIFVSGSNVNIKLENGGVIRASLDGQVPLAEGDKVRFFVSENDGQRIVLIPEEIIYGGAVINSEQTLAETAVYDIKKNPEVIQALKNCGYPVDSDLAGRAEAILADYPQTRAETAVFIAANNIPVTPQNLQIADSLFRSDFEIGREIDAVFEVLFKLTGNFADKKFSGLTQRPVGDHPEADSGRGLTGRPFRPENGMEQAGADVMPGKSNGTARAGFGLVGNKTDEINREKSQVGERAETYTARAGTNGEKAGGERQARPGEETIRGENRALLSPDGNRAESGHMTPAGEAMRQIFSIIAEGNGGSQPYDPEKIQGLADAFFTQIDKDCTGGTLKQAAMALPVRFEMLSKFLAGHAVSGGAEAAGEINSLLAAAGIFRSILPFAYMQMPVRTNNGRGTAQLYVYRRKRGAGTGMRRDLSVILTLQTAGMGHIEVYMRINGGGVSIKFMAGREEISDYIREHTVKLYRMLSRGGYRMSDIRFGVSVKRTTPIIAQTVFQQDDFGEKRKINITV